MWPVGVGLGGLVGVGLWLMVSGKPLVRTSPGITAEANHAGGLSVADRLQARLDRAGWGHLSTSSLAALWLGGSIAVGALVMWLVPLAALGPLAAAFCLLAGSSAVNRRIERRERALRAVWPGIVDHLRQAVRSGAGVGEAVWSLGDIVPRDLKEPFAHYRVALDRGDSVSRSLTALKADIANPVADRIIEALRMAHDVGGPELPRILSDLQESVRADWQVREDALAKQAWIRAASTLGVAAPWIVLILISGRTETQTSYSTLAGVTLLTVGAAVSAVAYRLMRKLGTLPEEKRWLA
jgi:tight adherence protein B